MTELQSRRANGVVLPFRRVEECIARCALTVAAACTWTGTYLFGIRGEIDGAGFIVFGALYTVVVIACGVLDECARRRLVRFEPDEVSITDFIPTSFKWMIFTAVAYGPLIAAIALTRSGALPRMFVFAVVAAVIGTGTVRLIRLARDLPLWNGRASGQRES